MSLPEDFAIVETFVFELDETTTFEVPTSMLLARAETIWVTVLYSTVSE